MLIPFRKTSSRLAQAKHMYVCIQGGNDKQFVVCQSYKPIQESASCPPFHCIFEDADIKRNPFKWKTTIDCDKAWCISNVIIDKNMRTTRRPDVCQELFIDIMSKIKYDGFMQKNLDVKALLSLNRNMKAKTA
jgi:hypothetical protein